MHKLRSILGPLRVFDAVRREGGVVKAAEVLHVTAGAVSQQLKLLESTLGIVLVRKEGRELEITETGEALGLRLADAFDRIERSITEVCSSPLEKQLRVKATPSLTIRWLIPRLPSFYAQHGEVDLVIQSTNRQGDNSLDQTDLVVRHGDGDWKGLIVDHLFDDELTPVCDPETAVQITSIPDLFRFKLLHSLMRTNAWDAWFASAGAQNLSSARNLSLANAAICYEAAADGLGIAMAQLSYVSAELEAGRLVAPLDHVARPKTGYYLVCDPIRTKSREVKNFRQWIQTIK